MSLYIHDRKLAIVCFFWSVFWAACLHSTTFEFVVCGIFWLASRIVIQELCRKLIYKNIKQVWETFSKAVLHGICMHFRLINRTGLLLNNGALQSCHFVACPFAVRFLLVGIS